MKIRQEKPEDKSRVATLLARTYMADGVKAIEMISEIRNSKNYSPALSLVAEDEGKPIACATFSPVAVADNSNAAIVLAGIGVDTKNPEINIKEFLQATLKNVYTQGHRYVLMRGDAGEFKEEGFTKLAEQNISVNSKDTDWIIADLDPNSTEDKISGEIELPAYL